MISGRRSTARPKSIRHFYADHQHDSLRGGSYVYMFYEDVHLGVAPIGGRTSHANDFEVRVSPDSAQNRSRLLKAIGPSLQYPGRDLADGVCEFLEACAARVVLYGRAVFEVASADAESVELFPLPPGPLVRLGRHAIQWIPPGTARAVGRRAVLLGPEEMWWLYGPGGLGRELRMWLVRESLRGAGAVIPEWAMPSVADPTSKELALSTYREKTDIAVFQATNDWGWPARQLASERMTNFHKIYRQLSHAGALARLREHTVTEFNLSIGARLGLQLEVVGLPTAREIDDHLECLRQGKLPFLEALNRARF